VQAPGATFFVPREGLPQLEFRSPKRNIIAKQDLERRAGAKGVT
jgi:hypothetical protein